LPANPCFRQKISDYHSSDKDQIWTTYLQKRSCQPIDRYFSKKHYGKTWRRFNPAWFTEYVDWLEYNILEDVVYCLYGYLFRPETGNQVGGDSLVI